MPKRPVVSGEGAVRAFERLGFRVVRRRSSHVAVRIDTPEGARGTTVPMHDEIARGTLGSMLRQAGVDVEEFFRKVR
jgi:predicted RNA binding protein YcfA (HicA-like mRNA interferase family)